MIEQEISKKIIDELLNFFYGNEIQEIRIGIEFTAEGFYIEIQGKTPEVPEDLKDFTEALNISRDLNYEEYSHELLGGIHPEKEDFHLLGALIDDVEVLYDAPILDVKIFRKAI